MDMSYKAHQLAVADEFPGKVRDLQGDYSNEHWALVDWGVWSRTLVGFEKGIGKQSVWFQGKEDENEAYGEVPEGPVQVVEAPAKVERLAEEPEDERRSVLLDERMHAPGGLSVDVRQALKVAYIRRYIPEYQYPRATGCSHDAFLERLQAGLKFVRRFL